MKSQAERIAAAFAVLDIEPTADMEILKPAIRKRYHETHPDRGGNAAQFKPVRAAAEFLTSLADTGELLRFVQKADQQSREFGEFSYTPEGVVPTSVRDAFPNFNRVDVLESLGHGRYSLWVCGQLLEADISLRGAVRTLKRNAYPGTAVESAFVYVFVPGKSKKQCTVGELEEQAEEQQPVQKRQTEVQAEPTLPAFVLTQLKTQAWKKATVGYVIQAHDGQVQLFSIRRHRGALDVKPVRVYASSAEALTGLQALGLTPDIVPVWISHSHLGDFLHRLGAA